MKTIPLATKDFISGQDIRWCPGCGDYSILKQVQAIMPELGKPKEDIVFISGIGCSSRFPYYMDTYGLHGIHGRATAIATGLKITNPDLSVWVITGDGDGLSIGANHLLHLIRRNLDINVLLFNNEIYGLTKGQYSPTSKLGLKTKSSPLGAIDNPFNPLALVHGADATFIARAIDRDPKNLRTILLRAHQHKGTSFVEIYQNCNVFNDGAFETFTDKETKLENSLFLEHDKPLVYGKKNNKGIRLNGLHPEIIDLSHSNVSVDDLWIHDETDSSKAALLTCFFDDLTVENKLPRPFGVFYCKDKQCFEDRVHEQINEAQSKHGVRDLDSLLKGNQFWVVN